MSSLEPNPHLERLRKLSYLLDQAFRVPGTSIRFGWDPIIGLFPIVGDVITTVFSVSILFTALRMGIPRIIQLRMAINILIDLLIGAIPMLGDVFDFAWKANTRNWKLLQKHAMKVGDATFGDWLFVVATVAVVFLTVAAPTWLIWELLSRMGWLAGPAWNTLF